MVVAGRALYIPLKGAGVKRGGEPFVSSFIVFVSCNPIVVDLYVRSTLSTLDRAQYNISRSLLFSPVFGH